jgi:hypothetical protein
MFWSVIQNKLLPLLPFIEFSSGFLIDILEDGMLNVGCWMFDVEC